MGVKIHRSSTNVETTHTIDITDAEALLVRKEGDTGDVFSVDTSNGRVAIGANAVASPQRALHISGANSAQVKLSDNDSGHGNAQGVDIDLSTSENFEITNWTAGKNITLKTGGANIKLQVDTTATAGDTALLLYDVDNNTLERVTVGAADSGGLGFKVLRIPN